MERIVNTGALGSCVLSFSYAFRGNDNEIFGGQYVLSLYPCTSYSCHELIECRPDLMLFHNRQWFKNTMKEKPRKGIGLNMQISLYPVSHPISHVVNNSTLMVTILGKLPVISTTLSRNADGLPLFPVFNRKTKTFMDMARILEDYFITLWGTTFLLSL